MHLFERFKRRWAQRAGDASVLREHLLVSVLFALTRAVLYLLGLRFNFALDWMFLSDPVDLREHLLKTVYYFHAYPPGMNVLTGVLLKLGGAHAALLAQLTFSISGLVLANSLLYLFRVAKLWAPLQIVLCIAFCLTPACLFFENLYLYEAPVAALLCLCAALFHRAVLRSSYASWFGFFTTCMLIGWVRSTFHLIWFAVLIVAALWLTRPGTRWRVLGAACAPGALLLGLYLKNFALFGAFGAASSGASNLAHVTVMRLPVAVRNEWIREGKLSPFAAESVYASPRVYLPYFGSSESERWPELNALDRPSIHQPNYNHWFFLEVGKARSKDARYYVRQRPLEYIHTVFASLVQIFEPSTIWHPADGKRHGSPHEQHRRVLGGYEAVYDRLVHGFPVRPVGLYAFLPIGLIVAFSRARSWLREQDRGAVALGALVYFGLFQIVFVVALSSAFTIGESSRYRYQIESMIWLVAAVSLTGALGRARQLWRAARPAASLSTLRDESSAK